VNYATRRTFLICLALALLTSAALWPVLSNGFINFDDPSYVSENGRVLAGLNWPSIKWAFSTGYFGNWHPLTWLSHMLDVQLFGLEPGRHHLTSLVLHTGSVLLLFVWLQRMTGAVWRSAFVAALFAVHPLRVESVAWIAERKDVLSVFFGMLSLWAYAWYVEGRIAQRKAEGPREESTQHATRNTQRATRSTFHPFVFYVLSLLFFALAIMSKAMLVTLPFALLLLDYWPLGRMQGAAGGMDTSGAVGIQRKGAKERRRKAEQTPSSGAGIANDTVTAAAMDSGVQNLCAFAPLRLCVKSLLHRFGFSPRQAAFCTLEKAPFFALGVACAAAGFLLLRHAGAITETASSGIRERMAYTVYGYAGHLGKLAWPVDLVLPYPRPHHVPGLLVLGGGAGLVLVSGWALVLLKRRPYLAVGWFWFLGCLVPVSGLLRLGPQALADRYTYFPSVGLFIALSWGVAELVGAPRLGSGWVGTPRRGVRVQRPADASASRPYQRAMLGPGLGIAAFCVLVLCVVASNRQAAYWRDSETLYRHGLAVNSNNYVDHSGLGHALFRQGKLDEAIRECQEAVRIQPDYDPAYSNLGLFYAEKKDYASAIRNLEEAVRLSPRDTKPRNNLGNVFYLQGRYAEAHEQFAEVLRIDPGHTDALNNRGLVCQKLGQPAEAILSYRRAIELRPDFTAALNNLAWLLATCPDARYRDGKGALDLATRACELTHYANATTLATLAAAYAELGQTSEATALLEQAQQRTAGGADEFSRRLAAMAGSFRAGKAYRED